MTKLTTSPRFTKTPEVSGKPSRRGFFGLSAAVGAAAATATLLPAVEQATAAGESLPVPPEKGGGYSVSAHVQRYYQTARV